MFPPSETANAVRFSTRVLSSLLHTEHFLQTDISANNDAKSGSVKHAQVGERASMDYTPEARQFDRPLADSVLHGLHLHNP